MKNENNIHNCIRFKLASFSSTNLLFLLVFLVNLTSAAFAKDQSLELLQLRPNLYMIAGAGANIVVQSGDDGVVVVDSGSGYRTEDVLEAINQIAGNAPM
ncbi:MAG: hypothetical protein CMP91_11050 [Gammaproteobacteria bacterium]|nr:hypothetical protein [Gammaproteobacteria bacterium]|tara:strand:- start:12325 stop:12624 length:300 start_codon:yes stop_codon:yes gene_type:complete